MKLDTGIKKKVNHITGKHIPFSFFQIIDQKLLDQNKLDLYFFKKKQMICISISEIDSIKIKTNLMILPCIFMFQSKYRITPNINSYRE